MIVMEVRFPAHPERGNSGRSARKKGPSKEELRIRLQLAPFSLTKKETEITLLLLEGLKRDEILENCEITNNTLKTTSDRFTGNSASREEGTSRQK
jgi:DNA-binding NarL/FixJ family response regulator